MKIFQPNPHSVASPQQRKILNFIEFSLKTNGFCPTYREIAANLGLYSISTVHFHLEAMEKKGLIERAKGRIKIKMCDRSDWRTLLNKWLEAYPESPLALATMACVQS